MLPNPKIEKAAFACGVMAQVIGWVFVFYGFVIAWTSSFAIKPFRYEGF